ncbi:MAG: preprotein translocase subunit SecG [Alphaproteobacteria bacterium]|nr:preprotein translocase subunit SecG [Alphaproteobacteria bacterium]
MQNVLLVLQLILAIALVAVILLQRTAQDGGGLMGGSGTMGGLFTARGSANLLTRTTAVLATLFILNSLALGILASGQHKNESLVDQIAPISSDAASDAPASEAPQVPLAQ